MAETHNGNIAACQQRCDAHREGYERWLQAIEKLVIEMERRTSALETEAKLLAWKVGTIIGVAVTLLNIGGKALLDFLTQ